MTSDAVNQDKSDKSDGRQLSPEQAAAAAMVAEARQRGLELTGPGGLLKLFTRNVLETVCVPKISSTLCDQAIFVDQATDARLFSDAVLSEIDGHG